MGFLRKDEALQVARRLLESSTADETEIVIGSTAERFVRFADTGPTQSADRERHIVAVRARVRSQDGWQEARATCDGLGDEQTTGALSRAVALARVAPPNPDLAELEGSAEVDASSGLVDEQTVEHGFEAKAAWIKQALAACATADLSPAGLAATSCTSNTCVNSAGRSVHDARTRAAFSLTASAPGLAGGAGFGDAVARRVSELGVSAAIDRAVGKAIANRSPVAVPADEYAVLLEPNAVSSILLFAAYQGFGAQDVHEESSFLCGRIGERCFPELLCVDDDAGNDVYPGTPFDGEGAPKQRVELIRRGVLTGPVTDADWARKLGTTNTGHALCKPNTTGPKPTNLVVHPGDSSQAEMIAAIQRGLLITQFHYTNLIDPKDLTLTGMTRNGTFLIENGEIVGAVKNLRFTESLMNAFGRVGAIGKQREIAGALFDGEVVAPAMRIDGFRFTSTTDF
jgi:PmbA protein